MHFLKTGISLLLFILIFSNCTNDTSASNEEVAKNICECTKDLVKVNQQMAMLQRDGKIEELTRLMESAGEAMNKAVECAKQHISEKTDKEDLKKALEKNCGVDKRMVEDIVKKL